MGDRALYRGLFPSWFGNWNENQNCHPARQKNPKIPGPGFLRYTGKGCKTAVCLCTYFTVTLYIQTGQRLRSHFSWLQRSVHLFHTVYILWVTHDIFFVLSSSCFKNKATVLNMPGPIYTFNTSNGVKNLPYGFSHFSWDWDNTAANDSQSRLNPFNFFQHSLREWLSFNDPRDTVRSSFRRQNDNLRANQQKREVFKATVLSTKWLQSVFRKY